MAELDGRVIAIAGAAGGLGPTVARGGSPTSGRDDRARPTSIAERLDELGSDLGPSEDRYDGRVVDLLARTPTRPWARRRSSSASAGSTPCSTWSAAGRAASRSPRHRSSDYEWLHDLLVRTVQHTTRAFYEQLADSDHGRFVLVSSSQAQSPSGTNASYAATKAAAESWTLALADSLKDTNATANIVVVNAILTPSMREENPDKKFPTFTRPTTSPKRSAMPVRDAAAKMNGKRLELHP